MTILFALLLIAVLLAGWGLTLLGMPGNWIMVLAAAVYAYFVRVGVDWKVVVGLLVLAAAGEAIELLAGVWGTVKAGGGKSGAVLALLGSLIGGIVGIFVGLPIPLVGSLIAVVLFAGLGAMTGAVLGEIMAGQSFHASWQIAKAAFWGRLAGTLGKSLVGAIMIAVVVAALMIHALS
jgi:uncharacterized protein YqgC (DUF456 family)